jgi:hypothetical protein
VSEMFSEREEQQGGGKSDEDGRQYGLHWRNPFGKRSLECRKDIPAANDVSSIGRMRVLLC